MSFEHRLYIVNCTPSIVVKTVSDLVHMYNGREVERFDLCVFTVTARADAARHITTMLRDIKKIVAAGLGISPSLSVEIKRDLPKKGFIVEIKIEYL